MRNKTRNVAQDPRYKTIAGVTKVALELYSGLDTPRSLACYILLREKEYGELINLSTRPSDYLDTVSGGVQYYKDALATDFLRKFSGFPPVVADKKKAAWDLFEEAEDLCFQTNRRLGLLDYPLIGDPPIYEAARSILARARKIAHKILGRIPEDIDLAFGPGTNTCLDKSTFKTVLDKLWVVPTRTSSCGLIFDHYFDRTLWGHRRTRLGLPRPQRARGNRFTTVPKTAKVDRGICVEPLGNLACQLSVGRHMKRRLGMVGIEVGYRRSSSGKFVAGDNQLLHRQLAREGSTTGGLATIDLRMASDTVSYELVKRVLPPEWFSLLASLRSPTTRYYKGGKWVHRHVEKFSSMGNGFTFELETLLFVCLIQAATGLVPGEEFWVFGDDIILPTSKYRDALAVLRFMGFEPNEKKSFHSGPFRESCGGDYWLGFNVRPVTVEQVDSVLTWFAIHNQLKARAPLWSFRARREIVRMLPRTSVLYGPPFLGDHVLHGVYHPVRRHDKPTRLYQPNPESWWVQGLSEAAVPLTTERWSPEFTVLGSLIGGVSSSGVECQGGPTFLRRVWFSVS